MDTSITLTVDREEKAPADARAFQHALDALLRLLRSQAGTEVEWEIAELRVGSAVCGIAPDRPTDAPKLVLDGLAHVAAGEGLPRGWGRSEVLMMKDLVGARAKRLGTTISVNAPGAAQVRIDDRLADELRAILQVKYRSQTSVVGVMDAWNLRGKFDSIGFTTALGGRFNVTYGTDLTDTVRQAIGRKVDMRCTVGRNIFGDIVAAELIDCEILPGPGEHPASNFRALRGLMKNNSFEQLTLSQWLESRHQEDAQDA